MGLVALQGYKPTKLRNKQQSLQKNQLVFFIYTYKLILIALELIASDLYSINKHKRLLPFCQPIWFNWALS